MLPLYSSHILAEDPEVLASLNGMELVLNREHTVLREK